jgi:prolyl oligopeptidase
MKRGLITGLVLAASIALLAKASNQDKYIWLEDVDGSKALEWVKAANRTTDQSLTSTPLYKSLYKDAISALDSQDKLLSISQRGDWIYNFWKGPKHPRGIYRRTSIESFGSGSPKWSTVLDIDKLSVEEGTKWVFQGMNCLAPEYEQCLVNLSPGGSDASELREFNSKTLKFSEFGFNLPTAKMRVSWIDEDHVYVGTDFGPESMTDSGYPRIQKIWKRGSKLSDAKTILEVPKKSVAGAAYRIRSDKGDIDILVDSIDFWKNNYYQYLNERAIQLNLPQTASINDAYDGQLVVSLKQDWDIDGKKYKQGSVLLIDPAYLRGEKGEIKQLIKANRKAIVEDIIVTKNGILTVVLEDVKSRVYRHQKVDGKWSSQLVDLPKLGSIQIESVNEATGEFFVRYEDFLTPPTLYLVNKKLESKVAMQQSATFDSSNFKAEQFFSQSKDGTKVPYFVIMNKNTNLDGTNPTHIFAYGGFRASLTPSYSGSYESLNGAYGKMWLERGGVYVVANIRGGGEYGPAWHAAALRENRIKAYEDFESIAEDLFARKITSAKHLGIEGRSNGGLLVGALMTRRPELYGAVICGVPLLDMQRYHKLLAGASWMAEYGDPDTDDWNFIKKYSPYQNVKSGQQYPPVLFYTSTRDDRVHPGHARKMAAKLLEQGQPVEYYENMEGGHAGSSTSEQLAKRIALSFTHLWHQLK